MVIRKNVFHVMDKNRRLRERFMQAVQLHVARMYDSYFDNFEDEYTMRYFMRRASDYASMYIADNLHGDIVKDPFDIAKYGILKTCRNIIDNGVSEDVEDVIWCFNADVQDTIRKDTPNKGDRYLNVYGYWMSQDHSKEV